MCVVPPVIAFPVVPGSRAKSTLTKAITTRRETLTIKRWPPTRWSIECFFFPIIHALLQEREFSYLYICYGALPGSCWHAVGRKVPILLNFSGRKVPNASPEIEKGCGSLAEFSLLMLYSSQW